MPVVSFSREKYFYCVNTKKLDERSNKENYVALRAVKLEVTECRYEWYEIESNPFSLNSTS